MLMWFRSSLLALICIKSCNFVGLVQESDSGSKSLFFKNETLHSVLLEKKLISVETSTEIGKKVKRSVIVRQKDSNTRSSDDSSKNFTQNLTDQNYEADANGKKYNKRLLEKAMIAENHGNAINDHPRNRHKQMANRNDDHTGITILIILLNLLFLMFVFITIYAVMRTKSNPPRRRQPSKKGPKRRANYGPMCKTSTQSTNKNNQGGPVVTSKSWKSSFFMKEPPISSDSEPLPRAFSQPALAMNKTLHKHRIFSSGENLHTRCNCDEEDSTLYVYCPECQIRQNSNNLVKKVKAIESSGNRIHIPISIPVLLDQNARNDQLDTITSEEEDEYSGTFNNEDKKVTSTTSGLIVEKNEECDTLESLPSRRSNSPSCIIPLEGPVKVKFLGENKIDKNQKVKEQLDKFLLLNKNKVVYADVSFDSKTDTSSDYGTKKSVYNTTTVTVNSNEDNCSMTSIPESKTRSTIYGQYDRLSSGYENQDENKRNEIDTYDEGDMIYENESNPTYANDSMDSKANSGNKNEVVISGPYQECKASVCSSDSSRANFLKRLGNGLKKPSRTYSNSEYRAGLIKNLNQRLKGTYLYSKGTLSDSSMSQCTSIPESPEDIETSSYEMVEPSLTQEKGISHGPKIEANDNGTRKMHKFLPRLKYMLKRKRQALPNENPSESSSYHNVNVKTFKLCPDCLKLLPGDVINMIRNNSSSSSDARNQHNTNELLHMDEMVKIYPNLYSKLPEYLKEILSSKNNDNASSCYYSHLPNQLFNQNKDSRWSEISSSFENIQC